MMVRKIIENFEKKNQNIKTFFLNKNKVQGFCRNYGMRVSSSEYIALDSDDVWLNKLQTKLLFIKKMTLNSLILTIFHLFKKEQTKKF